MREEQHISRFWMDPEQGDEWGLVGVGGNLQPSTLIRAYADGVFPWYNEGEPICWWSPDPRAIFELDTGMYISHRLARTIRSQQFEVTINQAFPAVMLGCADREEGTWITSEMFDSYVQLHELGVAHSVETWAEGELVGGVYGVALGAFFAGESMFHRRSNASKVALATLIEQLRARGYLLFDIQFTTEHTERLGAITIPRSEYLRRLRHAVTLGEVTFV